MTASVYFFPFVQARIKPIGSGRSIQFIRSSILRWSCPFIWVNVCLLFSLLTSHLSAQGQNINRQMANQLLAQLPKSQADTGRVRILFELGKYQLFKPGNVPADLERSLSYLNQAKHLSDSLHLLTWQHEIDAVRVANYLEGANSKAAYALFDQLIADCRRTGDRASEANARFRLGFCISFTTKKYPEIFDNYNQAIAIYRSLHNQKQELLILHEIAGLHTSLGQLDLAQKEFLTILKRYKAIGYPKLHYTYNWLSTISRLKGDFNKSLFYSLQCIESMNRTGDTVSAASFYGNLAQMYFELGRYRQSNDWYRKTLAKWRQEGLPNYGMYSAANIIVRDLIEQHKPQEALKLINDLVTQIPTINFIQKGSVAQSFAYSYDALKNDKLAEKYYLEAMRWYIEANHDFEMSRKAQLEVGRFYVERNQFKKGNFYVRPLLVDSTKKNSLSLLKDIHFMLFKIDSAVGDYKSAIAHFRIHKALNDSIFNETKNNQFDQLEVQYETQKNRQNIVLLEKQKTLQDGELKQARLVRNGILGGSVLLLCLLALSYNRYRLKRRSNQLLETKQHEINRKNQTLETLLSEQQQLLTEKEWMLKEIHHRVKNNLQIITSLLHSQGVFLKDEAAQSAIRESQNRVHAMALIHQKLYQSDRLAAIPMTGYVAEIIDYLIKSFDREGTIRKKINVIPLELDVTLAVPLGLILNEAVTNSLKYAFIAGNPGLICVELTAQENHYLLVVSDNGRGFPADFNPQMSQTLGMSLMHGLSKQIGGSLQIGSSDDKGVEVRLEFSDEVVGKESINAL
ncbi:tetratricopeptide repeat-containing sensor histidine kinase [Spirosoma pollinicola]|uniref:histidine kinase n=1 Tax=Spirosoma pollinicola TaxID=2057025 RepID=A0A2K8YU25_9BACT|nr:histidine kinase dimerization/phosphoacceptor domain -containing protein [Spirosoma pollinicola]AUD01146.1 histidine kinase [Spirosoma pollinicola]